MSQFLTFTVIGVTTGAILAVAASGLVVTYATSGIFNIAHGAMGMLAAFAYWQLRFDWGWPAPVALVIVIGVLAPTLGVLVERLAIRRLSDASIHIQLVVTVSLLVLFLQTAIWVWPPESRPFPAFFQGQKTTFGDLSITHHQMITMGCAIAVAVGLRLLLYRTLLGVTMRGVVDNRTVVELNGGSGTRAASASWAIGAATAALAGILVAPSARLSAVVLTLLVVNAYAAAVVGRLRSVPMAFAGAMIVGLLDAYMAGYLPTDSNLLIGLRSAVPAIVLFVALLVLGADPLERRQSTRRQEVVVPTLRWSATAAVLFVGIVVVVTGLMSNGDRVTLGIAICTGIVALSWVPLTGYAGQLSLCQLTIAGIGAMVMGQWGGEGSLLMLGVAALVGAAVGALVALPALRLSGIYLALATAGFAFFFDRYVAALLPFEFFGFHLDVWKGGAISVPRVDLPGTDLDDPRSQVILVATFFSLIGIGLIALRRSRFGRRLVALQSSPAGAAMVGVSPVMTKLMVFALAGAIAATGGALLGGMRIGTSAAQFDWVAGLTILMMLTVGGTDKVGGALFAGLALTSFEVIGETFPRMDDLAPLLPALIAVNLAQSPNGVTHEMSEGFRPLREWRPGPPLIAVGWVALYLALDQGWIDPWPWVIFSVAWLMLVGTVAGIMTAPSESEPGEPGPATDPGLRPLTAQPAVTALALVVAVVLAWGSDPIESYFPHLVVAIALAVGVPKLVTRIRNPAERPEVLESLALGPDTIHALDARLGTDR